MSDKTRCKIVGSLVLFCLVMAIITCLTSCGLLPKTAEQRKAESDAIQRRQDRINQMTDTVLSKLLLLTLACLTVFMVSCESRPRMNPVAVVDPATGKTSYVMAPDLGWSFMKKSDLAVHQWTNGTDKLTSITVNGDETIIPGKAIDGYANLGLMKEGRKMVLGTPGVYKGEALLKGTDNPDFIPKDPNLPTMQVVPEGSVLGPR